MSLAVLNSYVLQGTYALPIHVEVHSGPGLPAFNIVGLPDAGVRESRDRVRSAIHNSGFAFPLGRITVNLAPANIRKVASQLDLPIAIGILMASGQVNVSHNTPSININRFILAGELSLTGALLPLHTALIIALNVSSNSKSIANIILPRIGASVAASVPGVSVLQASSLHEVAFYLSGLKTLDSAKPKIFSNVQSNKYECLSEVKGQHAAKRVLEICASGGHSLLMLGTPGSGKSMLANRFSSILPELSRTESLEVAAIASLSEQNAVYPSHMPPFRAPHHTITVAGLIGGGITPRPGEVSKAHNGVLFLDELPEFSRDSLEALREPLENGIIEIARNAYSVSYQSRFILLAAMNPCPCGWLGHIKKVCKCTPDQITRYAGKLSGPLSDRIDIHLQVSPNTSMLMNDANGESSKAIRQRVIACRTAQRNRQGCLNAYLTVDGLMSYCELDSLCQALLDKAMDKWGLSSRAIHRAIKVARTIADMSDRKSINESDISEALQYRSISLVS